MGGYWLSHKKFFDVFLSLYFAIKINRFQNVYKVSLHIILGVVFHRIRTYKMYNKYIFNIIIYKLVGFGCTCVLVRCARPSFWTHKHAYSLLLKCFISTKYSPDIDNDFAFHHSHWKFLDATVFTVYAKNIANIRLIASTPHPRHDQFHC
jgi:hypothetical protein